MGSGGLTGTELVESIEQALAPWMPAKPEPLERDEAYKPRSGALPPTELEHKRLDAYARSKLRVRCTELAAMGKDSGRNTATFALAAASGRYVHHGILPEDFVTTAIVSACETNGLVSEDGRPSVLASIRSGLHKARNDLLPELSERPPRSQSNGHAHTNASTANANSVPAIELIPFDKIKADTEPSDLVEGVVPRVGMVVAWGTPKCCKSFWVMDLALHVALGWKYRGHDVEAGPVVYCSFEGAYGFSRRIEAFRQSRLADSADGVPFYLVATSLNLVRRHPDLIASIKAQAVTPWLVVLDTLNRSFEGSESSDADMTAYVHAADAIRDAFRCAVIIVHHCGHNETRARGHSALIGALDAEIAVERNATSGVITATVQKMKDGREGASFFSKLEVVEIGTDRTGKPITSCVVAPAENSAGTATEKRDNLTKSEQIALKALHYAIGEAGEQPLALNHIPKLEGMRVVTIAQWKEYAFRHGISTSDEKRAKNQAFQRGSEGLLAKGRAVCWEPWVWPVAS